MTGTVLIVDDSLTVRMDLAEVLEAAGLHLVLCSNAAEARAVLAAQVIDLVILDVLLPDANGVDLLQEIRARPDTRTLPILMLSTEADVRDRIRGLQTGADDYVGKPYDRDYVAARARELLRLRSAGRQDSGMPSLQTVLVVDDSTTFRERLREELEQAGYAVVTATSGEEGLRLAATHRPAALIVDSVMPGIDGATVVRKIRIDAALRSLPCILLTASDDHGAELQALDAGADAFVRKEDDVALLLARLAAVLRSTQADPEMVASLASARRILAVDDSMTYLHEISTMLHGEGYDVVLARSGEEAIEMLSVQTVDCILLDLLMPGLGGQESCRRIKATPGLRDIPLIMLTAVEDRETLIQGLATGADDYISKASDFDVLRARIQAQIRRKQFEDENRRIREQLLRSEIEATEARAARRLAEAKALLVEELESKNREVRRLNEELEGRVAERTAELERAYDNLRKTQQSVMQQERLRAFGQMASGVAHDINNALSPATLYIESILEQDKTLGDKTRGYLITTQRALNDVTNTVARMREFYRRRETQLVLQPMEINETIKHVIELTRARWCDIPQERGVVIRMEPDFGAGLPPLMGAENEVRDALTNLVLNAVDAMPDGGTLSIRTRVVSDAVGSGFPAAMATHVQIEVSDTGIGMDEATRRRCLEPFFTTKGERGTGLGLAMVYGMLQRHSGDFELESVPAQGTTFRLIFPVHLAAGATSGSEPAVWPSPAALRILVVDDDPSLLKSLKDTLEAEGHSIVLAGSGQAGIDAFGMAEQRGEPFSAVITDLGMPHVDGRRVAAAIKAASATTPVILLTGWGNRMLAEGDVPQGVDRVLGKPPSLRELRAVLAELTA